MKKFHNKNGFTLIELLIVIGILGILLAIVLIALNPQQQFRQANNTQRQSDVAAILDAVHQYSVDNKGALPPNVDGTVRTLSHLSTAGNINLCAVLTPTYIADLPQDPVTGARDPAGSTCAAAVTYSTGYTITSAAGNRVTVSAPGAELGATISVTR